MQEKVTSDKQSFWSHLDELRGRLIFSIISIVILAIPGGYFWEQIFDVLMVWPLRFAENKPDIITTAPTEAFLLSIKIAVATGIVAASPIIFYQMWCFVAPGLFPNEKKVILPAAIFSTIAFGVGIVFCYYLLPYLLKILTDVGSGRLKAMYTSSNYLGFFLKLMIAFGCIFELPVVSFVLTKLTVITPKFLVSKLRYAIVAAFILAAVLTPPDVVSQTMLALPLLLLYGISILISYMARPKKESV